MLIFIVGLIVVFALGIGWKIFRFMRLAKLLKTGPITHREATEEQKEELPEIPEISDEELRKKLRSLKTWTWVKRGTALFGVVIFVTILILGLRQESFSGMEIVYELILPTILVAVVVIGLFLLAHMRVAKLKALLGSAVTYPVLKEIFDVKSYRANGHIDRGVVASAGLVDNWGDIEGSDYFEGSYKGIHILYSDLRLSHEETNTDSDGNKTTKRVTDFMGQWLVCDFGKELSATVRLIERKGGTMLNRKNDRSKSDIETENMEFNKKFRIITADGHTAFYLLTPHFMEHLVAADALANSSSLFCFQDGKVHIALYSGRDSFELKGVKLDNLDNVRRKFRGELKCLTDIVDELLRGESLFKENQNGEKNDSDK